VFFILISFFLIAREIMLSGGVEVDLVIYNLSAVANELVWKGQSVPEVSALGFH
jgi:hypothetical protein